MIDLLPETILNKAYKDKHDLEYIDSINHVNMLKQSYDDIPKYTKQLYNDKLPQIPKNTIEIDTSKTTKFDGECIFLL